MLLCDGDCAARINSAETVTTASGLQYKDLVVGTGPQPITGYQVGACKRLKLCRSAVACGKPWYLMTVLQVADEIKQNAEWNAGAATTFHIPSHICRVAFVMLQAISWSLKVSMLLVSQFCS